MHFKVFMDVITLDFGAPTKSNKETSPGTFLIEQHFEELVDKFQSQIQLHFLEL